MDNNNEKFSPLDDPNLSREDNVKRSAARWKRLVEETGVDPLTAYMVVTMDPDEYWKHAMVISELKNIGGVDVMNFDYSNHKILNSAQAKFRDIEYEMDTEDRENVDMNQYVMYQHKDGTISLVPKDKPLPFTIGDVNRDETTSTETDTKPVKTLGEWMEEEQLTEDESGDELNEEPSADSNTSDMDEDDIDCSDACHNLDKS